MDVDNKERELILESIKNKKDEFVRKTASLNRKSNSMVNALKEKIEFDDIMDVDIHVESNKYHTKKIKCGFFGKPSSGKSSLINALIGKNVLPCGKGVTTKCFISLIGYKGENIYLNNNKGNEHPIELSNNSSYFITSASLSGVSLMNVSLPLSQFPVLDSYNEILDSPSTESENFDKDSIKKYFPSGDVFIYVIDSEIPLGRTDRDFLKYLGEQFRNLSVLMIINKWDRCDDDANMEELKKQHLDSIKNYLNEDLQIDKDPSEITFFISATEALDKRNEGQEQIQRAAEFERFLSVLQTMMCKEKTEDYLVRLGKNLDIEISIPEEGFEENLRRSIDELIKTTFTKINKSVLESVDEHFSDFSFNKTENGEDSQRMSSGSIDEIIKNILENTAYVELDELSNKIRTMMMGLCSWIIDRDRKKSYDISVPRESPVIEDISLREDMQEYYKWRYFAYEACSRYKFKAGLISIGICLMIKLHNFLNPMKREKEKHDAQLRNLIKKSVQKTLKDCQTAVEKDSMSKLNLFLKDFNELRNFVCFVKNIQNDLSFKD